MTSITFGILTISDSCSKKTKNDKSGPVLEHLVTDKETEIGKLLNGKIQCSATIPDDADLIKSNLILWSDMIGVNVILTTGGTGFSSRDVTPEATKEVIIKEAPGITHAILSESLRITPMSMLSRPVCGIRGQTLIINLPGSPKAVKECFSAIASVIPHAVDLILDIKASVDTTHNLIQHSTTHHSCPHKKPEVSLNLDNVAGRLRESPFPMISIEKSQEIMKLSVKNEIPTEQVNIWESLGRILAETVYSPCDLPPFRASSKDGYAVIASDGKGERYVKCGIEAGDKPGSSISPGTCVRINTGAPVPEEATAVVQVEDTKLLEVNGLEEKKIEILTIPKRWTRYKCLISLEVLKVEKLQRKSE